MLLDLFNQTKDKLLNNSKDFKKDMDTFLWELQTYFKQPKFNPELSKDLYQVDRFVPDNSYAILINDRTGDSYCIQTKDLPQNIEPADNIKIENGKYVLDNSLNNL